VIHAPMKTGFLAANLALALLISVPFQQARAQSQGDMNAEAARAFEKADAELNVVLKKLVTVLDDDGKKKLLTAQRAWVVYRDTQATFDADAARGGSMARGMFAATRTAMTEQRITELKKTLKFQEEESAGR